MKNERHSRPKQVRSAQVRPATRHSSTIRCGSCRLLQHIVSHGFILIPIETDCISFGPRCLCLAARPAGSIHRQDRGKTAEDMKRSGAGCSAAAPVRVEQGLPGLPQSLPVGALCEDKVHLVPPTLLPCGPSIHQHCDTQQSCICYISPTSLEMWLIICFLLRAL